MKNKSIKINAILNMVKTVSSLLFPLITFPYVSRVLMPENIGKINFGASFVSYFSLIASLGITTYAIRECSAKRNNKDELSNIASQIFSINVVTTAIAYIMMALTLLLFRSFDAYRTLIVIQSAAILFATLGCDWLNSAMEDFAFITIRTILFQLISLVLMFSLIHGPNDYMKYAAITVLSSSGANIVNLFYRRKYCKVSFVPNIEWKTHLRPILLLFVMILAQTIFNSSDITMLGLIKGDYEVGLYSSAVKMKQIISQVVTSLAWVLMPRMSMFFERNDFDQINKMLRKVLAVLFTIGLPCAVGAACLSKEIILIIAGKKYEEAYLALIILMIGFVFTLIGGSFLGNMVLLPSKREATYMKICVVSTVVNLVLNFIFIPLWGVNAAAATTAFSGLLIMILMLITKDKRIQIDNLKSIVSGPLIGCLIICAICLIIKAINLPLIYTTVLSVFLCVLIYFVIQIQLKNELVIDEICVIKRKVYKK